MQNLLVLELNNLVLSSRGNGCHVSHVNSKERKVCSILAYVAVARDGETSTWARLRDPITIERSLRACIILTFIPERFANKHYPIYIDSRRCDAARR